MDIGTLHIHRRLCDDPLGSLHEGLDRQNQQQVFVYLPQIPDRSAPDSIATRLDSVARTLVEPPIAGLLEISSCSVHDGTTPYIVMPFIQGKTLEDALAARQRRPEGPDRILPDALQIGLALATTLLTAHGRGQYHLALSPSQVILPADAKLKDHSISLLRGIGIARVTGQHRAHRWKPIYQAYASPEQLSTQRAAVVQAQSDVYSLGVLLFHMLSGRSPAVPAQVQTTRDVDSEQNPSTIVYHDVSLPGDLSMLLMRMLSVEPAERPSLFEVTRSLTAAAQAGGNLATTPFRRLRVDPGTPVGLPAEPTNSRSPPETAAAKRAASPAVAPPSASPALPASKLVVSPTPPAQVGDPSDPHIGILFGNFRAIRLIGRGGMGSVYEAQHQTIGRRAAVKILHRHIAQNEQYAKRFLNEARSVNIVRHPGLVEIFEYGQLADGTLYIVMEFLEGDSLYARMTAQGVTLTQRESIGVARLVARALSAAHSKGIIHRDLKPENIMLIPNPVSQDRDWVKILDFGIAKMENQKPPQTFEEPSLVRTKIGAFLGTPLYMAPEQHGRSEAVDGKADVFALGVILYELLTGEPPFEGNSLSLLSKPPAPLGKKAKEIPIALADLMRRMISAQAVERPSMEDVAAQLETFLPAGPRGPWRASPRLLAMAAVGGILLVLVILIWTLRPTPVVPLGQARLHALKAIKELLRSADANLQERAIAAIGQSRDVEYQPLVEPLLQSPTPGVVANVAQALGQLNALTAQPALIAMTKDTQAMPVRLAAAGALLRMQHPRGQEALSEILEQSDDVSKIEASLLLLEHGEQTGANLLWRYVERGAASQDALIKVLGSLARAGDPQARRRLSEEMQKSSAPPARLFMASMLTRLGDDPARALLAQALNEPKTPAERLLAARLLSSLGEPVDPMIFVRVIADAGRPDAERALALQGLADYGQSIGIRELDRLVESPGTSDRLRMAAAGTVLQIAAGEPAQLAEQSLSWAQAAVSSTGISTRQTAVLFLGEVDSDQAITPLRVALRDREREVRRGAAHALGKKHARVALEALTDALDDADTEVRAVVMQSIGQVATALRKRGSQDSDHFVVGRLEKMTHSNNEVDRVVASGTLLQLGDQQQKSRVSAGLSSKDPLVRRLAVEMLSQDMDLFQVALQDSDRSVRLAAARRLAAQGSHAADNVLREIVTAGDTEGLIAYGVLRKLGEQTPPPPDLVGLLSSGDLTTRSSVVAATIDLPDDLALRLLQEASMDPSAVIRRKAAEVAAERFRTSMQPAFLHVVRSLRNDPEVIVRSRSTEILEQLDRVASTMPLSAPNRERSPARDGGTRVPDNVTATSGFLLPLGEDSVRYQLDKGPAQYVSSVPVMVAPGRHHLTFAGGAVDFQVAVGATAEVRIPVSLAEQMLQDGTDAVNRKEYGRAHDFFERVRRLISRGRVKPSIQAELLYQQGRIAEARERWLDAVQMYTRYTNLPSVQQRKETLSAANAAMSRLAPHMGRIQIFTLKDGRCQMTQELFLAPNERHIINLGKGQSKEVRAQPGVVTAVRQCQ